MHSVVSSIHEILIRISGVDEVSGKSGTAEHLYEKSQIVIDDSKVKIDDDFDTVTTSLDDISTIGRSLSSGGSPKKFVHVDFNYQ